MIAYNGWHLGYSLYSDAANDPLVQRLLKYFYAAVNAAICLEYGIEPEVQHRFSEMSLKKFGHAGTVFSQISDIKDQTVIEQADDD